MPLLPKQLQALDRVAASAVECERVTGLPAALTLAQWALESGWGQFAPGNNCFGIKYFDGAHGSQKLVTHEYSRAGESKEVNLLFATFSSLEACFEKHARLITTGARYRAAWSRFVLSRDQEQLAREIAPIYATDPHYADLLLSIMNMPEVRAAASAPRLEDLEA